MSEPPVYGLVIAVAERILGHIFHGGGCVRLEGNLGSGLRLRDVCALRDLLAATAGLRQEFDLGVIPLVALNDVKAELRLHQRRDLTGLERGECIAERLDHHAAREHTEVAALVLGVIGGILLRHVGEVGVVDLGRDAGGELFYRILLHRRGVVRELEQDVARRVEVALGRGVGRFRARVRRHPGSNAFHEAIQARVLEHPGSRGVDSLGVRERIARGRSMREQLIWHPEVARQEHRDILVDWNLQLGLAEEIAQANHGQFLSTGLGDHVHMGRKRFLESVAGCKSRRADGEDEE